MKNNHCSLLLCILFLMVGNLAFAANIFVKKNGNDAFNGLSYAQAVKTIKRGLDLANPGDIVLVDAGVYNERIIMPKSGTPNNFITLTNYNNGVVYVDGSSGTINSNQDALLTCVNKSYIKIQNIQFRNNYKANARGILIYGAGKEYQITNCKVYNIGWTSSKTTIPNGSNSASGILVVGSLADSLHTLYFSGNEIYNCITGYSESFTLVGNVRNFLIENNVVHDNTNIGIDIAGHYTWTGAPAAVNVARNGTVRLNTVYNCVMPNSIDLASGIYVDGGKNIHIDRNRVFGNGCGISVGCENNGKTVSNVQVRANLIYNNKNAGIIFGANQPNSTITKSIVNNNTLYRNYTDEAKYGIFGAELVLQNCNLNKFTQNIYSPRTNTCVAIGCWNYTQTNNTFNYSLFWRSVGNQTNWLANIPNDPNGIYGDPKFVTPGVGISANFHIQTGSKAINKGNPAFIIGLNELDLDGQARIQQGRCDIGADETALLSLSDDEIEMRENPVTITADKITIFPNPTSDFINISPSGNACYEVYSSTGQLMVKATDQTGKIDVHSLPSGLYYLHLVYPDKKQPEVLSFSKL